MKNKVLYEVQGEIPPKYCVDGKKAVDGLNKLLNATDRALDCLNNGTNI